MSVLRETQLPFPHRSKTPKIDPTVFVAPGSHIIGDVEIGEWSNIWFNVVIRGDVNFIRVGKRTNIQDLTMVHVTHGGCPAIIGDDVTIGHTAIIHACTIGNRALIGMGAIILDGAEIGEEVLIGAGALITQDKKIPPRTKVVGRPGRVVAELTIEEIRSLKESADHYVKLANQYRTASDFS